MSPQGEYVAHAAHGDWRVQGLAIVCACGRKLYAGRQAPQGEPERMRAALVLDRAAERAAGVQEAPQSYLSRLAALKGADASLKGGSDG